MSLNNQKWHVFEVNSNKVKLSETDLKDKLEEYFKISGYEHEVAFAANKQNALRFKVDSAVCDHHNISSFVSKVNDIVGDVSVTCPGFGVENDDLANFVEPTSVASR